MVANPEVGNQARNAVRCLHRARFALPAFPLCEDNEFSSAAHSQRVRGAQRREKSGLPGVVSRGSRARCGDRFAQAYGSSPRDHSRNQNLAVKRPIYVPFVAIAAAFFCSSALSFHTLGVARKKQVTDDRGLHLRSAIPAIKEVHYEMPFKLGASAFHE